MSRSQVFLKCIVMIRMCIGGNVLLFSFSFLLFKILGTGSD